MMYPFGPYRRDPPEPKVYLAPETPAEQRVVDAARAGAWSGGRAGATNDWLFRRGDDQVRVTRDALRRMPTLVDSIVRQLK